MYKIDYTHHKGHKVAHQAKVARFLGLANKYEVDELFEKHRKQLTEGKHFLYANEGKAIVWTEKGVLMLVHTVRNSKTWEVMERMIDRLVPSTLVDDEFSVFGDKEIEVIKQ